MYMLIKLENIILFMSYIEVDQSGKVEQFNMDTVVALSNDRKYAVLIPKKVKQEIFMSHKTQCDNLKYKMFSTALYYCIKNFIDENRLTLICTEYERKESIIKAFLVDLLKENNLYANYKLIRFGILTKKSPAHKLAISVFRKTKEPDIALSANHICPLLK